MCYEQFFKKTFLRHPKITLNVSIVIDKLCKISYIEISDGNGINSTHENKGEMISLTAPLLHNQFILMKVAASCSKLDGLVLYERCNRYYNVYSTAILIILLGRCASFFPNHKL